MEINIQTNNAYTCSFMVLILLTAVQYYVALVLNLLTEKPWKKLQKIKGNKKELQWLVIDYYTSYFTAMIVVIILVTTILMITMKTDFITDKIVLIGAVLLIGVIIFSRVDEFEKCEFSSRNHLNKSGLKISITRLSNLGAMTGMMCILLQTQLLAVAQLVDNCKKAFQGIIITQSVSLLMALIVLAVVYFVEICFLYTRFNVKAKGDSLKEIIDNKFLEGLPSAKYRQSDDQIPLSNSKVEAVAFE